jgi:hypothetical protein
MRMRQERRARAEWKLVKLRSQDELAGEPTGSPAARRRCAYGRSVVPNELSTHVFAPGGSKSAASANGFACATDFVTVFPLEPYLPVPRTERLIGRG